MKTNNILITILILIIVGLLIFRPEKVVIVEDESKLIEISRLKDKISTIEKERDSLRIAISFTKEKIRTIVIEREKELDKTEKLTNHELQEFFDNYN